MRKLIQFMDGEEIERGRSPIQSPTEHSDGIYLLAKPELDEWDRKFHDRYGGGESYSYCYLPPFSDFAKSGFPQWFSLDEKRFLVEFIERHLGLSQEDANFLIRHAICKDVKQGDDEDILSGSVNVHWLMWRKHVLLVDKFFGLYTRWAQDGEENFDEEMRSLKPISLKNFQAFKAWIALKTSQPSQPSSPVAKDGETFESLEKTHQCQERPAQKTCSEPIQILEA